MAEWTSADPRLTRNILELPPELLHAVCQRANYGSLVAARCAARAFPVASVLRSQSWAASSDNAVDLHIAMLEKRVISNAQIPGLCGGVRSLSFANGILCCGSKDSMARVFDLVGSATGSSMPRCLSEFVHPDWVGAVAMSPDGQRLATGCDDAHVRIWSSASGEQELRTPLSMAARGVSSAWIIGVGWVGNERLISCSRDSELALWRLEDVYATGTDVRPLASCFSRPVNTPGERSSILYACFDSACGMAAAGSADNKIDLYQAAEASLVPLRSLSGHNGAVHSLTFDTVHAPADGAHSSDGGDGRMLASGGSRGSLHLWDMRIAGGAVAMLPGGGESGGVRALALGGQLLISTSESSSQVFCWDLRSRRIFSRLRGHTNNDALALDSTRRYIASGGRMPGELRTWEARLV